MTECAWLPCPECGASCPDYNCDGVGDEGPWHTPDCENWMAQAWAIYSVPQPETPSPAEQARDEALDRVERANEQWISETVGIIQGLCRNRERFTTDAIWAILDRGEITPPDEPRAMGAAMRRAVALGYCEATNETRKSVRVECHARPVRVWASRLHAAA